MGPSLQVGGLALDYKDRWFIYASRKADRLYLDLDGHRYIDIMVPDLLNL